MKFIIYPILLLCSLISHAQSEIKLVGVANETPLFIRNTYNVATHSFCIAKILINGEEYSTNINRSAVVIKFTHLERYSPITVSIFSKDSVCNPVIINPEAIRLHSFFRFEKLNLTDSVFSWETKGERGIGQFFVEKLDGGIWKEQEVIAAVGDYNHSSYSHFPMLEEGGNKFRVRYEFPLGGRIPYLISPDIEYNHYPDPVTFTPKSTKLKLKFSRSASYAIYDSNTKKVLEGHGVEADVRRLRRGQYVIYFDEKDPSIFYKE